MVGKQTWQKGKTNHIKELKTGKESTILWDFAKLQEPWELKFVYLEQVQKGVFMLT